MPDKGLSIKKQELSAKLKTVKLLSFLISFAVFFLCFLGLGVENKAHAATYYVDSSITDTNPASATPDCTNYNTGTFTCSGGAGSAYKTIADVNAKSFSSDDQILFRKGQTWREQLTVPSSGTSGHPITFGAFGSGNKPIVAAADIVSSWSSDKNYKVTNGSNTLTVSSTRANNGTYSGKSVFDGTNMSAYATKGLSDQDTVYLRGYFYLNAGFGFTATYKNSTNLAIYDGTTLLASMGISSDSPATTLKLNCSLGGSAYYAGSAGEIVTGQWYRFTLLWKKGTGADGGSQCWVDGSSKGSNLTSNQTAYAADNIEIGGQQRGTGIYLSNSTLYFDDIKADTSDPGTYSGGGEEAGGLFASGLETENNNFTVKYGDNGMANVYNTTLATNPNVVVFDGVRGNDKTAKANLTSDGDFYYTGTTLSIFSSTDPSGRTIEAGARDKTVYISNKSHVTIQNIDGYGSKASGITVNQSSGDNSNIKVDGSTSSNNYNCGFYAYQSAGTITNLAVENSTFYYNGGIGIRIVGYSNGGSIKNNTVYNNSRKWVLDDPDFDFGGGIKIASLNVTNVIIEGNTVYNNAQGLGNNGFDGVGIWVDSTGAGNVVRNNYVYNNNKGGIMVENVGSAAQSVYYNIVYGHTGAVVNAFGIYVYRNVDGSSIYNNTAYGNVRGIAMLGTSPVVKDVSNNLFKNNISVGNTYQLYTDNLSTGNIFAYNSFGQEGTNFIWWDGANKSTYNAWETAYGGSTNSVEADPQLVAGGDAKPYPYFYPRSYSPVINAGTDVGLTKDYLNVNVPQGAAPDIGAFEYTVSIPENIWFFFPLFLALPRLIFILQNKKDRKYFLNLLKTHRYKAILLELYFPYLNLFSQLTKRADK